METYPHELLPVVAVLPGGALEPSGPRNMQEEVSPILWESSAVLSTITKSNWGGKGFILDDRRLCH